MATVKLADIIDVEIYNSIEPVNNPQSTKFFESGVVVNTPQMNASATGPAELVNMVFWRDLDITIEPNYSSDADTRSTPNKIIQGRMAAMRASLNQSWAARDLTNEMTMGQEAMERIKDRTSNYWRQHFQDRVVAATLGIYRANIIAANAGSETGFGVTNDMVWDVSIDTGVGTAPNFFDFDAFTAARWTMGEDVDELAAILVHPKIAQRMQEQDDIDYIRDSKNEKTISLYQGHQVIVSDKAPVLATTTGGGLRYITTLFGKAAFAYGNGQPTMPTEVERDPSIGDGAGEEIMYERKTWIIHPFGWTNLNFASTAGGGLWQNLAELRLGTNWKRVVYRRNVPIAFLVTNG